MGKDKQPIPFATMDSSEFRRPYLHQQQHQQQQGKQQRAAESMGSEGRGGNSASSQWQRQRQRHLQEEMWRQQQQLLQQQLQSSTKSPTNSFKPLPFQSMSQADFRQPYPGSGSSDGFGNDRFGESARFDNGPPQPYGFGAGDGYDLPPEFASSNDQRLTFEDDDQMLFSPFMVPPMIFAPLSGGIPKQKSQSPPRGSDQQDGVKVPKDPFRERQKKRMMDSAAQSPSSPSSSSRSSDKEIKIPKDPFAERRKEQNRQQQPPPTQQQQSKDQKYVASSGGETKAPTNPLNEQQMERKPKEPNLDAFRQSRSNNDDVKQPKDPFDAKTQQQRRGQQPYKQAYRTNLEPQSISSSMLRGRGDIPMNSSSRGLGSVSSGSRNGDDMTYEEYSSYFDTP